MFKHGHNVKFDFFFSSRFNSPERTVSGWLPSDFMKVYRYRTDNAKLAGEVMTSQGYDAAWAMALALNATQNALIDSGTYFWVAFLCLMTYVHSWDDMRLIL